MLTGIVIVIGAVFAIMGIRKGFCKMWIICFNLMISVFLSIMTTPAIIGLVPATESVYIPYYYDEIRSNSFHKIYHSGIL